MATSFPFVDDSGEAGSTKGLTKDGGCPASVDSEHLLRAAKKALDYLEGVEGEFNIILDSAEACRNAIAKIEGRS